VAFADTIYLHFLDKYDMIDSFKNKMIDKIETLDDDIPTDLFIIAFTSISLSLAEYAYRSKKRINIEKSACFLFYIILQGLAKH